MITMEAGVWYRMRYLMASTMYMVNGEGAGDADTLASCKFKLMAKDGIYLLDGIRDITKFFLYPGARADIMAQCTVPGSVQLNSVYFEGQESVAHHVPNYIGTLFNMTVVESANEAAVEIPAFETQRPCYVSDTRSVLGDTAWVNKKSIVYDECETGEVSDHRKLSERKLAGSYNEDGSYYWEYDTYPGTTGMGMTCEAAADGVFLAKSGVYCQNGCAFELGLRHDVGVGSALMDQTNDAAIAAAAEVNLLAGTPCLAVNPDQYLEVGDIMEWDIWGIDYHPVHFHVNPYQLVDIDYDLGNQLGDTFDESAFQTLTGNFFHVGDFGDVMMVPAKHVTLHQQLATFATTMVNHCHILLHEDLGMMQAWSIGGEEGTKTNAQLIDTTCYWSEAEKTGFTITAACASSSDCPSGWSCPTSSGRKLKFGHTTTTVCEEDSY